MVYKATTLFYGIDSKNQPTKTKGKAMKRIGILIAGLMGLALFLNCNPTSSDNSSGSGTETVKDVDGNIYHTVKIGTQTWTVENLKTTHYNDGTAIPLVTGESAWGNLTTGGYCWYNNNSATYKKTYGAIYNWYAVNTGKLALAGWHVPTDAEWGTLSAYLGGDDTAGGKLKEVGTTHWRLPNTRATNSSGFTALPGGCRNYDGVFHDVGDNGYWWSSTAVDNASSAYSRHLFYNYGDFYWVDDYKNIGFSVRLVRD